MLAHLLLLSCQLQGSSGYESLLDRMTQPVWMAEEPTSEESTRLFSSRDPKSLDPASPDWHSEHDRGNFLGTLEGAAGTEFLMVDATGPGVLSRLRLDKIEGVLRFYVDDERTPFLEASAAEFFGGDLIPHPFSRTVGTGGVLALPIPFSRRLQVTTTDQGAGYAASVLTTPLAQGLDPVSREFLARIKETLVMKARQLLNPADPIVQRKTKWMGGVDSTHDFPVTLHGNGAVHWVRFTFIGVDAPLTLDEMPEYLRALRLQTFDNVEASGATERLLIDVPFGDFFAASVARTPIRSATLGHDPVSQAFYCRLPMPYTEGFRIRVSADRELPKMVRIRLDIGFEQQLQPPALRLRAAYFQHRGVSSKPPRDLTLFETSGAGRLVGLNLTVLNGGRHDWSRGDEKIWVDGENTPRWFGTALGDYFDRTVWHEGPENFGYTALVRSHLGDPVVFHSGLRFDVGMVHPNDCEMNLEGVAMWYGDPDFPLPQSLIGGDDRVLPPLPEADFEFVPGALDLARIQLKKFKGEGVYRGLIVPPANWQGQADQALILENALAGSYASLQFPFLRTGAFRIKARFLGGAGGKLRFRVNGQRLAREVQLPVGESSVVEVDLGLFRFTSSSSQSLIIEVIEGAELFGISQFVLQPVES